MGMNKVLAAAALATTGAFGASDAEAGEVQWSVTIGSPFYSPAPVYIPPPPVAHLPPAPVYWARGHGYHSPRHWDRDGDGIPNRYDHRYTPRWDRDGDGIPNRYDRFPNGRHGWQGDPGGRRGHDGRGGHDWQGGGHDGRGREQWGGGHGGRGSHDGRGGGRGGRGA